MHGEARIGRLVVVWLSWCVNISKTNGLTWSTYNTIK